MASRTTSRARAPRASLRRLGQLSRPAPPAPPQEGSPEDSPLMDAPNTVFTPHIGASSKENMGRIAIIIERVIEDYIAKKES